MNDNERIKRIDRIIYEAVLHGGDMGGPYLVNEDHLAKAVNSYLKAEGLDTEYKFIPNKNYGTGFYEDFDSELLFFEKTEKANELKED